MDFCPSRCWVFTYIFIFSQSPWWRTLLSSDWLSLNNYLILRTLYYWFPLQPVPRILYPLSCAFFLSFTEGYAHHPPHTSSSSNTNKGELLKQMFYFISFHILFLFCPNPFSFLLVMPKLHFSLRSPPSALLQKNCCFLWSISAPNLHLFCCMDHTIH